MHLMTQHSLSSYMFTHSVNQSGFSGQLLIGDVTGSTCSLRASNCEPPFPGTRMIGDRFSCDDRLRDVTDPVTARTPSKIAK